MKSQEIMQEINSLLDKIVTRTITLNKHSYSDDRLLDVDLMQDDLRQLYRRLESLRSVMADAGNLPPADTSSDHESSVKEEAPSEPLQAEKPPEKTMFDKKDTSQNEASLHETKSDPPSSPSPDSSPPSKPEGKQEEGQIAADHSPSENIPEAQKEQQEDKKMPPSSPDESQGSSTAADSSESPPYNIEKNDPATHPEQSQPKAGRGNGNRAVIDILSEYSDRTIGDTYLKEQDDSLHNRIANSKEDKSIGERMQQQPLENLKDAIGVNEKFLFINELFDGNIQAYNEAISRLNSMEDSAGAFDLLNNLGIEFSWDVNRSSGTIEKLAQLVQRRYVR